MSSIPPRQAAILSDRMAMETPHEANPAGVDSKVGWYNSPTIGQGMSPTNDNIPWWTGPKFPLWTAITGWWIAYRATTGHTAVNTSIEVCGQQLAILRNNYRWDVLFSSLTPAWIASYQEDAIQAGDPSPWTQRGLADGVEFQPGNQYSGNYQCIHAGTPRLPLFNTSQPDYLAIYVAVRHRLAKKNRGGVDDRNLSNFIVQAGADYWPSTKTTVADLSPAIYLPGVGVGRFVRVTSEWRCSTFLCEAPGLNIGKYPPPALIF